MKARLVPILVFVNKAPLEAGGRCVLSEDDVAQVLQLDQLPAGISVKVVTCNGFTGSGVDEGFSWLGA